MTISLITTVFRSPQARIWADALKDTSVRRKQKKIDSLLRVAGRKKESRMAGNPKIPWGRTLRKMMCDGNSNSRYLSAEMIAAIVDVAASKLPKNSGIIPTAIVSAAALRFSKNTKRNVQPYRISVPATWFAYWKPPVLSPWNIATSTSTKNETDE